MVRKSMDGNEAAAYASYAFTEVATIYPITPSSPMANHVDEWAARGKKNLFGTPVRLMEMRLIMSEDCTVLVQKRLPIR